MAKKKKSVKKVKGKAKTGAKPKSSKSKANKSKASKTKSIGRAKSAKRAARPSAKRAAKPKMAAKKAARKASKPKVKPVTAAAAEGGAVSELMMWAGVQDAQRAPTPNAGPAEPGHDEMAGDHGHPPEEPEHGADDDFGEVDDDEL